jgi:23S rRNA (cytosine1962-C5)-methyltransferase
VKQRRARKDLSLIEFECPMASEARLCRELLAMGMAVVGRARDGQRRQRRRTVRCFLHRAEIRLAHPITRRRLKVVSAPPDSFDGLLQGRDVVSEHLRTALAARLSCILNEGLDAYRLITGPVEGVPGLVAERYGPHMFLTVLPGAFQGGTDRLRHIGNWYRRILGAESVQLRHCPKGGLTAHGRDGEGAPQWVCLLGAPCVEEYTIVENGLRFLVKPSRGADMGLFLDQRDNRGRVRALASDRRVLNLFAYTCGFSVAAAAGEARSVTSVDLKASWLEWGKANFELNGLPLDGHRFFCSEAFEYIRRAERQSSRFDLIVIDPPTFARSKRPRRTFSVAEDLCRLLGAALPLLAPQGLLLVSTNYRRVSKRWLVDQVRSAAGGRRFEVVGSPPLPVDFAADPDHAKSLLARFV